MTDNSIQYTFSETARGVWRSYRYESGRVFREYRSKTVIGSLPLIHMTFGKDPATGRRITAKGVIAIGRFSRGVVAIGQFAAGIIAVCQIGMGLLFFGQVCIGLAGIAQLAGSLLFAAGQLVTGYVAIGQLAYGHYVLAQAGAGAHVWSMAVKDPEAVRFFTGLYEWFAG